MFLDHLKNFYKDNKKIVNFGEEYKIGTGSELQFYVSTKSNMLQVWILL